MISPEELKRLHKKFMLEPSSSKDIAKQREFDLGQYLIANCEEIIKILEERE